MKIAICDDDIKFLTDLKNELYNYSNEHNWETVIDTFKTGNDLVKTDNKYNIIILDYKMEGIDGIETAKELRNSINQFACIIFLTSHPDIAISAYDVDTYRFVLKSSLYDGIFKALDDFRSRTTYNYDISVKSDSEFITINTEDIVYIEASNKDIYIYTTNNGVVHTKITLTKIFKELPKTHFFRIHKGFVINFSYVEARNNTAVKMHLCDNEIPISRNYLTKFKNAYYIYLKDFR
jgi:DNA-binding LytR/AlgR family response regulator